MPAPKQFIISKRDILRLHGRAYRAQQKDQSEVCGAVVLDEVGRLKLNFVKNSSPRPGAFLISIEDCTAAEQHAREAGFRIGGWFHSHPVSDPTPSPKDIKSAPINSLMLIYDVCGRTAQFWRVVRKGKRKAVQERGLIILNDSKKPATT